MLKVRVFLQVIFCLCAVSASAGIPSTSSITVRWTAPGDDKNVGRAYRYDVRYSTSPITAANWAQASPATQLPLPAQPGNLQTCTIYNLLPSTTYYFRMKTADEKYNWSGLSNLYSLTTCGGTCTGTSGNVDCSPDEVVDIADLATLLTYLYVSTDPMCFCLAEANVDGDALGHIDIGDIAAMIGYLYLGQSVPAGCGIHLAGSSDDPTGQ